MNKQMKTKKTKGCLYPTKGYFKKNGKLYIRIVENFMVRDILIPSNQGNVQKLYYCSKNYKKINDFSQEVKENSEEAFIRVKREQNKAIEASAQRVNELRQIDAERTSKNTSSRADLQDEDNAKTDYSLKRAKDLILNQKDELKVCNKFILEAKCQQIRKDQIAEKVLIKEDERNRLKEENEVMIQKMLDEATEYEKSKELTQTKKQLYVQGINSQIKENQLRKQIEHEQLTEEGRLEREASIQQMINDIEERDKKKKVQFENVKQLNDYNKKVIKYMKAVENEERIIEERKIKEYHEEKERKEKEFKAEKDRLKKEKEKIIADIMARQMKTMADAELRESIYTQYVQDLVERKWRMKEKEEMEKKMKQKMEMMRSREYQKKRKNELIAAETVAEKEEFHARMKILEEQREKEIEIEKRKKEAAKKHRMELINQVHEKELKAIEERKGTFIEAKLTKAVQEAEKKEIREHIENKIKSLSDYDLPQNYQTQIRRKLMKQKILS